MKLVAYFNDDCIIHVDDIDELARFLENSPLIKDVFLSYDSSEIENIIFEEVEHDS